jgi:two-component system, NtrC family, sensor kinase
MPKWDGRKAYQTLSLRTQLIIWLLLASLIPLGGTAFISYQTSKKIILKEATKHLQSLSIRQAHMIEYYFKEKERDILSMSQGFLPSLGTEALQLILIKYGENSFHYLEIEEYFRSVLNHSAQILGYHNIFLLTKEGTIVFSLIPFKDLGINLLTSTDYPNLTSLFQKTIHQLEINRMSIISPIDQSLSFFIASPLVENKQLVGLMIFQLDNSNISQLMSDYQGTDTTRETLLVSKVNNQLLVYDPFRLDKASPLTYLVEPDTSFGQFIKEVIEEKNVTSHVIDYQGKESLMVGQNCMPTFGWTIITKIDQTELLAPIKKLKYLFWILIITTSLIIVNIVSHVAKQIVSPILALIHKTKLLAGGDLSQRVTIVSQNEVGRLGQSFNAMAAQLDHIVKNLDSMVAQRTKVIEHQKTKLQQTILELNQTRDRLVMQEKLASLGTITGGIAHEIKNPLNFVNNFAELCLGALEEAKEQFAALLTHASTTDQEQIREVLTNLKFNLNKIYEHGKRADSIVFNMLQHSQGNPGTKTATQLNPLLDEYVVLAYHGMRAQNHSFSVQIEKLYDQTLPLMQVVPQEIGRVFLNLLNNAFYSVREKSKKNIPSYFPLIKVKTENHSHFILISIWDNGLGLDAETYSKIFTPFFTTKPPGEGTGLGLSLSYTIIVQGHQGTLTANTYPNEFAEFVIRLPVDDKLS